MDSMMAGTKDYQVEFRRFISGQHLYTGVRVTACVIIPAWLLYDWGLLSTMISIPLGALFVGLTDNPGPVHHRRNGMLTGAFLNFLIVIVAGLSRFSPWLIGTEIVFLGIATSLIAVYGARASAIGLTALIVFILSIDDRFGTENIFSIAFYYLVGGLFYTVVSLSLNTLRPYRPLQQLLGECLMKTSSYLLTKSAFYSRDAESSLIISQLIEQQVRIHQYQEQLRSMLFSTRRFISESTSKGRILTIMFRDNNDLFERVITAQYDYAYLHKAFDDAGILSVFQESIRLMAGHLYRIGLAVQEGVAYTDEEGVNTALKNSVDAFSLLRKQKLNAENVEAFIKLRHILNSIQDLADRIKRMQTYTTYERSLSKEFKTDVDLTKFTKHQEINVNLIRSNLSLDSSIFRHALRLTLALMTGYLISLFFPLGHGYWILLTIATIIRPEYSLSKQRNIQRLAGTFLGAILGFLVLYFSSNDTVIFMVMITMMVVAYSLLRINYAMSIAGLTIYLLLSFHFFYPQGLNTLLFDRVVDTVIGSVIAYAVTYLVLPKWEHEQIESFMTASIEAARKYFLTVAQTFSGTAVDVTTYKMARKEAFVHLANLSDAFQRMLSDPKNQQPNLALYHQFVSASHMLVSHIATLSAYVQQYGNKYSHPDFQPLVNIVDAVFERMKKNDLPAEGTGQVELQATPILRRVERLLGQRKNDLQQGLDTTSADAMKTLNDLVKITDQFKMIHATAGEAVKIFNDVKGKH